MSHLTIQQTFDLAMQHHRAGRLPEAERFYWQVLTQQPAHIDAMHHLGVVAHQMGRNDIALDLIRRAIALRANFPEAYSNLGIVLADKGQVDDAIAAFRQAIALKADYAEAHYNLGVGLKNKGQIDEAIAAFRQAIALKPDYAEAHNNLGNALKDQKQFHEAIAAYRIAIASRPDFPDAYNNLGNVLGDLRQFDEAIAACRQSTALRPNYAEAYSNLGIALKEKGRLDEAIAAHRQAIALSPNLSEVRNNFGGALVANGQLDEAVDEYRVAITLSPNFPEAHYNLSLALLMRGDFQQGWEEYEWRWKSKNFPSLPRSIAQPQWDGGPLESRTLLLYTEQGLGDAVQFIRYLPLAAERGGRIVIECPAELRRLFQTLAGGCRIVNRGDPLPEFDLHCPLLSLPRIFGTTLSNLPNAVPYLRADPRDAEYWKRKLEGHRSILKVGLAWAGNAAHRNDHNRSVKLSQMAALSHVPGVRFFSLQKGEPAGQAKTPPAGMDLIDWTGELNDFADTAGLIANLDLVIAVDTAVAHLAGAMGKPVWTLLPSIPDWRWLMDREDSPWYPSMRLFRQPSWGDWDSVIARVADALGNSAQSLAKQ